MQGWLAVAAALALLAGPLPAQDALAKLQKEMKLVMARGAHAGPDLAEVERIVGRACDLSIDLQGEPGGLAASAFVLDWAGLLGKERHAELFTEMLDSLVEHHLDDAGLDAIVLSHLGGRADHLAKPAAEYLEWIARDTKSAAVRAACRFSAALAEVNAVAGLEDAKRVLAKLAALKKEIGDLASPYGMTWGEMIDEKADALEAIGRPAREIAGKDLDGVPFKLSDYRGKVVLLDFWGYW